MTDIHGRREEAEGYFYFHNIFYSTRLLEQICAWHLRPKFNNVRVLILRPSTEFGTDCIGDMAYSDYLENIRSATPNLKFLFIVLDGQQLEFTAIVQRAKYITWHCKDLQELRIEVLYEEPMKPHFRRKVSIKFFYFTSAASSKVDLKQQNTGTGEAGRDERIYWQRQWAERIVAVMRSEQDRRKDMKDAGAFEREFAMHLRVNNRH
jgi:hypothetical protein